MEYIFNIELIFGIINLCQQNLNIRQVQISLMGNQQKEPLKKLIKFQCLTNQLAKCEQLGESQCPIYGRLHKVSYQGKQIFIGKSQTNDKPDQLTLHHVLYPNVLLIPPHVLLQNIELPKYETKKQLINIINGISELGVQVEIGLSCNRVAFSTLAQGWKIVGDVTNGFTNYQALIKSQNQAQTHTYKGIYFSPELMKALSKDKLYPKISVRQSDVFILGIMLLQIIFQQKLQDEVYDYQTYQIKLGPILQKLMSVQQLFGNEIYQLIVRMLEFNPTERISFEKILQQLKRINSEECYSSPVGSRINELTPPVNTKPKMDSFTPSPQPLPKSRVEDRGRSPGVIRKNLPLNDRETGRNTFSPIRNQSSDIIVLQQDSKIQQQKNIDKKRRISNGSKITPNRLKIWEGMENQRPKVEPFGLKIQSKIKQFECNQNQERKTFSKLKSMRV